jgi:hypothetical protein
VLVGQGRAAIVAEREVHGGAEGMCSVLAGVGWVGCSRGGVRKVREVAKKLLGGLESVRNVQFAVWGGESGAGERGSELDKSKPEWGEGFGFRRRQQPKRRAGAAVAVAVAEAVGAGAGGAETGLEGCACADPPWQPVGTAASCESGMGGNAPGLRRWCWDSMRVGQGQKIIGACERRSGCGDRSARERTIRWLIVAFS